jgi:thioredoxin reductase (NADPH)
MVSEKEVVLFTQSGCRFCKLEREWLSQHDVSFKERNITDDPNALADLEQIPAFSTPVTLIDGEVVFGFDRRKLSELLGI